MLEFDDLFCQGEPQARSSEASRCTGIELLELDEQFGKVGGTDTDSSVADAQPQAGRVVAYRDVCRGPAASTAEENAPAAASESFEVIRKGEDEDTSQGTLFHHTGSL